MLNDCRLGRRARQMQSQSWINGQVLRLCKALRDVQRSEVQVDHATWAQDPLLRLVAKEQLDEVESMIRECTNHE